MLILRYIAKLLKALSSDAKPWQLGLGFLLGMIIGLTPIDSIHNLLILILLLSIKVNLGMAFLAFTLFSGIAYLADPLFDQLGYYLLTLDALQGFWTDLYNKEWIAITRFYNTLVLGSLVAALALCIPGYPALLAFVKIYRKQLHDRVKKWKLVKAFKSTKLYTIYDNLSKVRS